MKDDRSKREKNLNRNDVAMGRRPSLVWLLTSVGRLCHNGAGRQKIVTSSQNLLPRINKEILSLKKEMKCFPIKTIQTLRQIFFQSKYTKKGRTPTLHEPRESNITKYG